MIVNARESLRIDNPYYNLVAEHEYAAAQFGSCANLGRFDLLPYGIDVIATTDAMGDSEQVNPTGIIVKQKQIDIGGGNYLIARWCQKPLDQLHLQVEEVDSHGAIPYTKPNHDGPPCWCGYWENASTELGYGWLGPNFRRVKSEAMVEEFYSQLKTMGECTVAFLLSYEQETNFETRLVDPMGWAGKEVFKSSLIHNRAHPASGNTLTLHVFQFKE